MAVAFISNQLFICSRWRRSQGDPELTRGNRDPVWSAHTLDLTFEDGEGQFRERQSGFSSGENLISHDRKTVLSWINGQWVDE